jgi:hypothetical protein
MAEEEGKPQSAREKVVTENDVKLVRDKKDKQWFAVLVNADKLREIIEKEGLRKVAEAPVKAPSAMWRGNWEYASDMERGDLGALRKTIKKLDEKPDLKAVLTGHLGGTVGRLQKDNPFGVPPGARVLYMVSVYPHMKIGSFFEGHGIGTASRIKLLEFARNELRVDYVVGRPGLDAFWFLSRFHRNLMRRDNLRERLGIQEVKIVDEQTGRYCIKFKPVGRKRRR